MGEQKSSCHVTYQWRPLSTKRPLTGYSCSVFSIKCHLGTAQMTKVCPWTFSSIDTQGLISLLKMVAISISAIRLYASKQYPVALIFSLLVHVIRPHCQWCKPWKESSSKNFKCLMKVLNIINRTTTYSIVTCMGSIKIRCNYLSIEMH